MTILPTIFIFTDGLSKKLGGGMSHPPDPPLGTPLIIGTLLLRLPVHVLASRYNTPFLANKMYEIAVLM